MRIHAVKRLCAVLLLTVITAAAQSAASTPSTRRPTSTPYTGDLSIFETPGRAQKLHIDQVMNALKIEPGNSVADIGAGSGWFTVRAAKRIDNDGTVYAVDINSEAISYIQNRVKTSHITDVKTILSKPDNPGLPANSVNAVLFLKSYHEVADPVLLMKNLRASLKPEARIGIIDRDGNGANHGVNKEIVLHEAGEAGYRLIAEHDDLVKDDGMDYFLVLGVK